VLLVIPLHAFLGMALLAESSPLVDDAPWSLADQRLGAGIVWASGDVLAAGAAVVVFVQWANAEQRAGERADRRSAEMGERSP
jgi:cytochrome c oxidase assembly factor CtaG